jgi:hypothetical protein
MAQAAKGRPQHPSHRDVLDACKQAATDGVACPLSSTHYFELQRTKDPVTVAGGCHLAQARQEAM